MKTSYFSLKFLFYLLVCLMFHAIGWAQKNPQLEISYESYMRTEFSEEDKDFFGSESYNAFIDYMNTPTYYQLVADKNQATYHFVPRINNSQSDVTVAINNYRERVSYYYNLDEKLIIESHPPNFLVQDSISPMNWKLTRDKKQVCGIETRKATLFLPKQNNKDSIQVTAWYAPSLSYKFGPKGYHDLPGLILELKETYSMSYGGETDSFEEEYICEKIKVKDKNKPIERPVKGKKVSREELAQIWKEMEEKYQEMNNNGVDTEE